jgi:hypothetical protein
MTIKFIAGEAISFVAAQGGKMLTSDKGRVSVDLPAPWSCVSGTWVHPDKEGLSVVTASGVPLIIDLGPAEAGWVLMAASNGLRQSIADAASAYKLPVEKTAKIIERANLLSPGKTENWGKPERAAPLADPLRAAILAILTGKISRFGADAPKFKGTTSEMLAIFREFGETKLGKFFGEPEWAEIERKIREEAAAILTAAGDQDDVFG